MTLAIWLIGFPAALLLFIFMKRVIDVFVKHKDLRRFHAVTPPCSFTNQAYILHNFLARRRGLSRTEVLHGAHQNQSILRLGPSRLSFASPDAIEAIYGTRTKCIKGDQYTTPGGPEAVPNLLTVVDKQSHAIKRKRLSAAFATSHLLDWEFKVADKVERLLYQLDRRARADEIVDFRFWSNLFTLDAIMDIALSSQTGFMESESDVVIAESVDGSKQTANLMACLRAVNRATEPIVWSRTGFSVLKNLSKLLPESRRQWHLAGTWQDIVRHQVSCRLALEQVNERPDDLFACLLRDSKGRKQSLDKSEIMAEVAHFRKHVTRHSLVHLVVAKSNPVDAGSDTTSIALTHVVYSLAKHPDKLTILRDEVDECLRTSGGRGMMSYEQLRNLPYLRACLDEAMRLRPALSAGMQRRTPPEGISIAGEWIPGDMMVSVPAYIAHREPDIFPDPEDFIPERWLSKDAKEFQKYILTFSAGGRVCIGKNITYLEQSLLLAAIVHRYEFALPTKEWEIKWEEYFNLWPKELPLKFRLRS